ncbi:LOW QUALITY PROTEIN: dirigent protein 4-like [Dioscorea cayenensis subsp. rotundata]|uniref:Dirigent protein n=1 Tax=Dioscorea cayennensis subsp. rotundata TaxID=55577 RepID=A0AB40CFZ7_DIOCR|nr:LOW QUALITY PROTEIN: dirigent protein 4-like [Dioscorea cayenensis subsp. rotundata]
MERRSMYGNLVVLITITLVSHACHAYLGKEKVTKLHFFFHDTISGDHPSAVPVALPEGTVIKPGNLAPFGAVYVVDDPLTEGPDLNSKVIGHAQGFYVSAAQKDLVLVVAYDLGFTSGEFNGSSISVLSRNPILISEREVAIVGGRGKFRMARGFAKLKSYSSNATTGNAVVEYHITVFHY